MSSFQRINNISGWLVFAIATLCYWLTVEPTASYWDCGEFIAVSYKLEVPHPPGAPLYLLIGRMFSFLAGGDVTLVAYWINIISVLASGFAVLFLFWTITLLGRKLFSIEKGKETTMQTLTVIGGGLVGALSGAFADSFWFSAEEAEVYAMSGFFTAFVVWAMLKWELIEDESLANKWIILIAYMMGLSIGVHLLNLVTIPALALIYYFKKYKPSRNGIIAALITSGLIIILINNIIIPGLPSVAGSVEIFFVNSLGLPFASGFVSFFLLLVAVLVYGIVYSNRKEKAMLNTALLSLAFILIGYASYTALVIRSNYDPPIDENNPENIISFVSYLKREQYGSRPLVYGQYFDAEVADQVQTSKVYEKGEERYIVKDRKLNTIYDKKRSTILPRIYSSDPKHVSLYRDWMNLGENEKPDFIDNIWFMFRYQIGHMYMRYFMWNFAGRESDIQHAGWLDPVSAFEEVPEELADNKARNNFFMLPLLLGIVGMVFQYNRRPKDFAFVALLFFLTGIALVLYLNSPPVEPRERDYIYAGSFWTFGIWIGYGVMALANWLNRILKNRIAAPITAAVVCLIVPGIMAYDGWDDHDRSGRYFSVDSAKNFLSSCAPNSILFTGGDNDTFPLWYAQEVEGFRTDVRVIVLSYFNTDWYINQMTRQAYESDPLPFSLTYENYKQGGLNDYLPFYEQPNIKGAINLNQFMKLVRENHPAIQVRTKFGALNSVPSKTFFLNVDSAAVANMDIVPEELKPNISGRMNFGMKRNILEKNTLMILDLIANNNWERPIYFNSTSLFGASVDFSRYVVQEGIAYRLLPVENPSPRNLMVNTELMHENVINKFQYRGLDDPEVYNSVFHRNFALNMRSSFNSLASAYIQRGEPEKAVEVLEFGLEKIPDNSIPYDRTSSQTVGLLLQAGEKDKALNMANVIKNRSASWLDYLVENKNYMAYEPKDHLDTLYELLVYCKREDIPDLAEEIEGILNEQYENFNVR